MIQREHVFKIYVRKCLILLYRKTWNLETKENNRNYYNRWEEFFCEGGEVGRRFGERASVTILKVSIWPVGFLQS